MILERYAEKVSRSDHQIDFLIHGLNAKLGRLISKLETVRLKPRKTLDRKLTREVHKTFGDVYWHFAQLLKSIDTISFSELSMGSEPDLKNRHFDEGFTHLRKASLQAAEISEWRKRDIEKKESIDSTPFQELHFRMRRAAYHFGLFDLRTVLERDLQRRKNDKSLTLYD